MMMKKRILDQSVAKQPAARRRGPASTAIAMVLAMAAVCAAPAAHAYNLEVGDAQSQRIVAPADVERILPRFEAYAQDLLKRSGVPGFAVGIVADGKTVLARGWGVADVRDGKPVTADTLFPLASVSKSLAGASVAALVGEGKLEWDDKVSTLARDIRFHDPYVTSEMTLRDLLSQRTGYAPFYGEDLDVIFGYGRQEVFHRLRYLPPATAFRTHYAYSNWNLTLGGEVAAQAVGMHWEDLVRRTIIEPLGMHRTVASRKEYLALSDRAAPHLVENGKAHAETLISRDSQAPAGGLSSTVNDMLRWLVFEIDGGKFQGRQVVAEAAMRETQTPQSIVSAGFPAVHYGLGLEVRDDHGRKELAHNGGFEEGINTRIAFLPNERLGIVILTNAPPMGIPEALEYKLQTLLFQDRPDVDTWPTLAEKWRQALQSLLDRPGRLHGQPPAGAHPVADAARYVGRYSHPYYGDIVITAEGSQLKMRAGNAPERALQPWQGDTFRVPTLEDDAVTFLPGAGGASRALTLSPLEDIPDALFTRSDKP
jgi:CubicO group peptidase (beta-lactamase class C family)